MTTPTQPFYLFGRVPWLRNQKTIQLAYKDEARSLFVEAPSIISKEDDLKGCNHCIIGRNTGLNENVIVSSHTVVGRYCSIASYVQIGPNEHSMEFLSTGWIDETDSTVMATIIQESTNKITYVGCDVWIGANVVIKRGVAVGPGACVGAGAVVTKDVPPYAIVAGVPAKILRFRFPEHIVKDLLDSQWWTLEPHVIKTLPWKNVEQCIAVLKKIRRDQ